MDKIVRYILITLSALIVYVLWGMMNEFVLLCMLLTGLIVLGIVVYNTLANIILISIKLYRRIKRESKAN